MRRIAGVLTTVVVAASFLPVGASASFPFSAALLGLSAGLVTRDTLRLVLATDAIPAQVADRVVGQLLVLGEVPLPTAPALAIVHGDGTSAITLEVVVPAIPEDVLTLPLAEIPVRWQGLDREGRVVADVRGLATLGAAGNVTTEESPAARDLARLADHSVRLRGFSVAARLLIQLHNPMGFEVTVTRMEYLVSVGGVPLVAGERPGFRLRPQRDGDVLIEAEIPLTDLAAGVAGAVLQRLPVRLDAILWLRTPAGDRGVPYSVSAGL